MRSTKIITFTGILLGLVLLFFLPIFRGEVLFCCDNLLINIPARSFLFSQLPSGTYPLWNPYIFSGSPFLADINLSPLYLGIFVEYLLSLHTNLFTALTLSATIHVMISFLGVYWCCRLLKIDSYGSIVGAITYAFSGTIMTYLHNMPMLQVAALFPWVLGTLVQFTHTNTPKWFILFVLVGSLQLIAGHPQLTFYSWFIYLSYYVVFSRQSILKKFGKVILMLVSVSLLSSIQLIPFVEFALQSTRIGGDYAYATQGSLPLVAILRLIIPSIVGDIRQGTDWWQGGSVYGFVSLTSLLLALSVVKKNTITLYFAVVGLVSLLIAFGNNLPIYSFFYRLIPGVSLFRVPAHFLFLYTISISLLAGFGFMHVNATNNKREYVVGMLLGSIICLVGIYFYKNIGELIYTFAISQQLFLTKVGYLGQEGISILLRTILVNCLVLMLIAVASQVVTKNKRKMILVCGIIIELFLYSRTNFVTIDQKMLQSFQDNAATFVQTLSLEPNSRMYTNPQLYPAPERKSFNKYVLDKEIEWQFRTLRPNLGMLYQTKMVNGYASLTYKKYQEIFKTKAEDPTGIVIPESSRETLLYLSASRILNKSFCNYPCDTEIEVLTDPQVLPYSRLETMSSSIIPVIPDQHLPNYLLFTIHSSESGKLVVAETAYTGWQAHLNGNDTQLLDEHLLSVSIPSGDSQVEFVYAPSSVKVGSIISIGMFFVLILSSWYLILRNQQIISRKNYVQKTTK